MVEGELITLGSVLKSYSEKIISELRSSIMEKGLIASRGLLQSVQVPVKIFGSKYILEITFEDYWKWAESGRSPGKSPPIESILKWIKEKGIPVRQVTRSSKLRRRRTIKKRFKGSSAISRARSLAFLISRSIGKRGTIKRFGYKGSKFYSEIINEKFFEGMKADISEAIKKDFVMEIKESIKE